MAKRVALVLIVENKEITLVEATLDTDYKNKLSVAMIFLNEVYGIKFDRYVLLQYISFMIYFQCFG